jgi:site-specific recombinase XerD
MDFLSKAEVESVLRIAWKESARDHLMLLLSFGHALRASEVVNLRVRDVLDGTIYVARRKGSLATDQPLLKSANVLFDEVKALSVWLMERGDHPGPLFPSKAHQATGGAMWRQNIAPIVSYYMGKAGIKPELAHHHSFKHAAISHMRRSGVSLDLIKQFAGHQCLSSTVIYTNASDGEAMTAFQGTL